MRHNILYGQGRAQMPQNIEIYLNDRRIEVRNYYLDCLKQAKNNNYIK